MNNGTASIYEIRVAGRLGEHWSDWLGGLEVRAESNDESVLRGRLPDQAALLGVLAKIHALNLTLTSVLRCGTER